MNNRNFFSKLIDFWRGTAGRNFMVRIAILVWRIILGAIHIFSPNSAFLLQDKAVSIVNRLRLIWAKTPGKYLPFRFILFAITIVRGGVTFFYRTVGFKLLNRSIIFFLPLINSVLVKGRKHIKHPDSVLHISFMVHIPYYMTRILRRRGIKADYLAVRSQSPWWDKCDYRFPQTPGPVSAIDEFLFFWRVVAKYEVIHSHFGIMFTESGWELPLLKKMGRKIVVHYRGCEARDQARNMELHPKSNICQDCDYNGMVCRAGRKRVELSQKYGDEFLVTTPDMQDFMPTALHFPFFLPEIDYEKYKAFDTLPSGNPFKIVHVTNHPGIEGTRHIQAAIDNLKAKGYEIQFNFLKGVTPEKALEAYRDAHLSIGKMKMGYYANAQIESMYLGVPAVTNVRPEFMTPELERSGFIFSTLEELESTLEYYLNHPADLAEKRAQARSSILELHNENRLTDLLLNIYGFDISEAVHEDTSIKDRIPRVLFIGNIANNAYYNAKFLRRSGAAEVDVLCYDDYWIMSSPEWEEADFEGDIGLHYYPNWDQVDLKGYKRPKWFAQGSFQTAVEYLIAFRRGDIAHANLLWERLEMERRTASISQGRVPAHRVAEAKWQIAFRKVLSLFSGEFGRRLFKSPPSEGFIHNCMILLERFDELFPDRLDKPSLEELAQYQSRIDDLTDLFPHYDIVQGYAIDPILPMLAGFKPYAGFEHGTLRDAPESSWEFKGPFHANSIGRLTALSYAVADHVFITNEDCVASAERLGLKSYSLIPHPLDEIEGFYPTDEFRSIFQKELGAELIFFCPIRHDWVDKGVDRYVRALPGLREALGSRFKVVFTPWGREIDSSKSLIRELGCEDLVTWQGPFGRVKLARWLASADVVFDQLSYSAFSGLTPRALACGVPVISGYNPTEKSAFFAEPAPVLWATEEPEIIQCVLRSQLPGFRESYRALARTWVEKYHSSDLVVETLTVSYKEIFK